MFFNFWNRQNHLRHPTVMKRGIEHSEKAESRKSFERRNCKIRYFLFSDVFCNNEFCFCWREEKKRKKLTSSFAFFDAPHSGKLYHLLKWPSHYLDAAQSVSWRLQIKARIKKGRRAWLWNEFCIVFL